MQWLVNAGGGAQRKGEVRGELEGDPFSIFSDGSDENRPMLCGE